jgi:hypothetical protein
MVEHIGMVEAIKRMEQVDNLRANANATLLPLLAELANFRRHIAASFSFSEKEVAEATRATLNDAGRTLERSRTLDAAPEMAAALPAGRISRGHVDALSRAAKISTTSSPQYWSTGSPTSSRSQ